MPGGYEKPITIEKALQNIVSRNYLLPAIQRKFTWSSHQICVLFDSIMRDYPINTFMFWEVTDLNVKTSFRFYQFLEKYCQRFNENNPDFDTKGHKDFYAIIDGQQRLTSLYIGLKGTYAYKLPRIWWPKTRDDNVLPPRKLYLNLTSHLKQDQNESMMLHEFDFLTEVEYKNSLSDKIKHWFEVGNILNLPDVDTIDKIPLKVSLPYLDKYGIKDNEYAVDTLTRLYYAIRKEPLIHYYKETNQAIDHVLDIFIRTNDGGTPLAHSDLLMSIAVANWKKDARQQIDDLVDQVRFGSDMSFSINRDFVLKTSLMLTGSDVGFKVKNFSEEQVGKIETEWDDIKACLLETFRMLRLMGFNDSSLRAKNAAIPIAYYLFHKDRNRQTGSKGLYADINRQARHSNDRKIIAKWLHMSLLKGVFGGQVDTLLMKLRKIIKDNLHETDFPLKQIVNDYRGTNKDLFFDGEFTDRLLKTQKEDAICFSILALLFPDLDYTRSLDIDHLHPAVAFSKKRIDACQFLNDNSELRAFYEDTEHWNSILNLHLLDSSKNQSKGEMTLKEWVAAQPGLKKEDLMIPTDTDLNFQAFPSYIADREEFLKQKLNLIIEI